MGEELEKERDGTGSVLVVGATDCSVDQQYRPIFCALNHVRSSY